LQQQLLWLRHSPPSLSIAHVNVEIQMFNTISKIENTDNMQPFSTCVVKIHTKNDNSGQINYSDLLCEGDKALDTQSYEIVCMGGQNAFSITDIQRETEFTTYIQFDFPSPVMQLEEIESEIRQQVEGACSIDIIKATDYYRLLLFEKCDISFR